MSAHSRDLFDVYTEALEDWFRNGKHVVPIVLVSSLLMMLVVSYLASFAMSFNMETPPAARTPASQARAVNPAAAKSKKNDADPRDEDAPSFAAVAAEGKDAAGGLKKRR